MKDTPYSAAYNWVHVWIAAMTMAATFPGRTHGLGLVTESLLTDLNLDRLSYGIYNFWATLIGAFFCFPIGYWIDRNGCRIVSSMVLVLLGIVVLWMSQVQSHWELFTTLVLTRGLGQSALSVVSIALVSKYFPKTQLGIAMGVYSVIMSFFFILINGSIGQALNYGVPWRTAWAAVGIVELLVCTPLAFFLIRRPSLALLQADSTEQAASELPGVSCREALGTYSFWVIALSISFFGLTSSGISLFQQSILQERGFDAWMYRLLLILPFPIGLAFNLIGGVLCRYFPIHRVLAAALFVMGTGYFLFPWIQTTWQVVAYTFLMAAAGGTLTVLFFSVWAALYGQKDAGRIQGIAQMATVFASAVGPPFFAVSQQWVHSYSPVFYFSGGITVLFAVAAFRLKRR
jgi:MFS family permease